MEGIYSKSKTALQNLLRDPGLFAAMAAAVFSALFVPPSKAYWGYMDLHVHIQKHSIPKRGILIVK